MTRRKRSRRSARNWSRLALAVAKAIGKPIHDRARQGRAFRRELSPRVAEIGQGEHDSRGDDADANLERAVDGEDEDDAVRASDRPENVDRNDRRGVAGERRGVSGEIAQERRDEGGGRAPERKSDEKAHPILAKEGGEDHDRDGADHGSDHSEHRFAQRGSEHRLADERGCRRSPRGLAELKREGDIERQGRRKPTISGRRGARASRSRNRSASEAPPDLPIVGLAAVMAP